MGKGTQSTPPAPAAAVLSVLGNDDLLREILLRVGFPTSLVRAALVCRHWYRVASHPDFLRRFRDLHPPRLLGFYTYPTYPSCRISNDGPPQFVPMLPQHPELAAVLRRASFSLDASLGIMDCRNGRVLVNMLDRRGMFTQGVHLPLQPARAVLMVPPLPVHLQDDTVYAPGKVVSKEDEGGLSYFFLLVEFTEEAKATASVYALEDDVWSIRTSATTQLPALPPKTSGDLVQLVDDRFYMAGSVSSILVLDLTSSGFFTIELPDGVCFSDEDEDGDGDILLSPSNDSAGIYLVRLKDLKIQIWLHRGIDGSVGGWLLCDTICLWDPRANLRMPTISMNAVGDNAEFVFLDMGRYILHLDVKSKVVRGVHEMTEQTETTRRIHPFMMIWPPVFPVLKKSCKVNNNSIGGTREGGPIVQICDVSSAGQVKEDQ